MPTESKPIPNAKRLTPDAPSPNAPDLLTLFTEDLHARGVVGEDRALKLLYLILTSRLLPRPVSAILKGPSSAGKSFLIDRVLEYFPKSAYYELSSMSEHAMVYDREPLVHRMLILYESRGANELTSYLLRSILSEGRVRYVTADNTVPGAGARTIERAGPTGLITTTTDLSLHPENETRMISIPITDTASQTAQVLAAIADDTTPPPVDPQWPALQTWLQSAERRVRIPYARALMAAIPPVAVRLRRDAKALVSLIHSHAIIHQATRERDREGRIVATLVDYEAVRPLVRDIFAETSGAAVPTEVRRIVATVDMLTLCSREPVKVIEIARVLEVDKSTASRHVKRAIALGYLKSESGSGRVFGVSLADPLPPVKDLLPEVAALQLLQSAEGAA